MANTYSFAKPLSRVKVLRRLFNNSASQQDDIGEIVPHGGNEDKNRKVAEIIFSGFGYFIGSSVLLRLSLISGHFCQDARRVIQKVDIRLVDHARFFHRLPQVFGLPELPCPAEILCFEQGSIPTI